MHIHFDVGSTLTMINSLPFHFDKNNLKLIFISFKTKSYIEKVCNISKRRSKRIENKHFAFICTICTICTQVQINLLHLESRGKFLKHCSHGQKYTRGANLHNCAHEPSFKSPYPIRINTVARTPFPTKL